MKLDKNQKQGSIAKEVKKEQEIKEQIENLRKKINECNYYYYSLSISLMSDTEFDMMLKKLEALEREYPKYASETSPTKKVGSSLKESKFKKVKHRVPMLSLMNTYSIEDVEKWIGRVEKTIREAKLKEE